MTLSTIYFLTLKGFRLFWLVCSSVVELLYNMHKVLCCYWNWTGIPPICLSLIFFFQMSQPVSWSSFTNVLLASNSLLVQVLQIEHLIVTPQSFIGHPSYSPIEHWAHRPKFLFCCQIHFSEGASQMPYTWI